MSSDCPGAVPDLDPEVYSRWRTSQIGAITEYFESQLILELAGNVSGRAVLDIGCGDGALTVSLAERGAAAVTGIDASAAMINAARQRAAKYPAVSFEVGKAEHLPFPSGQFDVVTAITILCFVENARPVFEEIARVLRPGGRVVIGELGKWSTWAAARRLRAWLGSRLWRRGYFRTAGELRALVVMTGLRVVTVRGAIYYPRWECAARVLSPCDSWLGRLTTLGAGFLTLLAEKPRRSGGSACVHPPLISSGWRAIRQRSPGRYARGE